MRAARDVFTVLIHWAAYESAGRMNALDEINTRQRIRLGALEREQQEMAASKPRRKAEHRPLPVPRELHEPGGATRWKCTGCSATFGFLDEVEDSSCAALSFLFDGVGCG